MMSKPTLNDDDLRVCFSLLQRISELNALCKDAIVRLYHKTTYVNPADPDLQIDLKEISRAYTRLGSDMTKIDGDAKVAKDRIRLALFRIFFEV